MISTRRTVEDSSNDNKTISKARERLKATLSGGGFYYCILYFSQSLLNGILETLYQRLVAIEQRKGLIEPWTIMARRFTAADNKRLWNDYDWSLLGEEWTRDAAWKDQVITHLMVPNVPEGGTIVEIGPGGGRWTELLQRRAKNLIVIDISEKAIQLCRKRFGDCSNISFLIGDGRTINVPDTSIDAIWSYDVFVHINPLDARTYLSEFFRILKPNGRAVIHHPGPPDPGAQKRPGWRSDLTDRMVLEFAAESGLGIISQTREYVNKGDVLTIFEKPSQPINSRN